MDRTDITLLDIGLHYVKSWDGTPASGRLEVDPLLTLGYANAEYAKPAIDARYHQFVGEFIQWEARANAITTIGGDVPQVELPSFGGDGIGARLQGRRRAGADGVGGAERGLVPGPARSGPARRAEQLSSSQRGRRRLRRRRRARTTRRIRSSGVKAGAGVGLRLVWQDFLTLRLDWAHAIGDQDRAPREGAVYFTVTTRRGF